MLLALTINTEIYTYIYIYIYTHGHTHIILPRSHNYSHQNLNKKTWAICVVKCRLVLQTHHYMNPGVRDPLEERLSDMGHVGVPLVVVRPPLALTRRRTLDLSGRDGEPWQGEPSQTNRYH